MTIKEIEQKKDEIISLIDQGCSTNAIAVHFGTRWKTMRKVLTSLELTVKKGQSTPIEYDFTGMHDIDVAMHINKNQAIEELRRRGYSLEASNAFVRNKELKFIYNGNQVSVSVAKGILALKPSELAEALGISGASCNTAYASRAKLVTVTRLAGRKNIADFRRWMDSEVMPKMMPAREKKFADVLLSVPGGIAIQGNRVCASTTTHDGFAKTRFWLSPTRKGRNNKIVVRPREGSDTESVM